MNMSREPNSIAVIDLETTGLFPWRHDRIVEIAIVKMSQAGDVESEYDSLVNPDRDIGPTRIHGIESAEVLIAPKFDEIAGDVLYFLKDVSVIAGHNISFDRNFLVKEFERVGITLPEIPSLCTFQKMGRSNLASCCEEFGVVFEGAAHWALHDARATAKLVHLLIQGDPESLEALPECIWTWPILPRLDTPTVTRQMAMERLKAPPTYLQRIASQVLHDCDLQQEMLAYLGLLDRILEDRVIDWKESDELVAAAQQWRLSREAVQTCHRNYLQNLVVRAVADGIVTDSERRDLCQVSKILGEDSERIEHLLETAQRQLKLNIFKSGSDVDNSLQGKSVCFTGELISRKDGQPISRGMAEELAKKNGLVVVGGVSKKLDLLVVADPNTQSGKAKKARAYGTRIFSEAVFWQVIGLVVD